MFDDKPVAKVSSYDYTIPSDQYATANRISIYAYEDAARTKEIDSKQVNIVAANPTPFPRPEPWSADLVYMNGEYLMHDDQEGEDGGCPVHGGPVVYLVIQRLILKHGYRTILIVDYGRHILTLLYWPAG